MDMSSLKELLYSVKNNLIDIDSALEKLRKLPFEDIGFGKRET